MRRVIDLEDTSKDLGDSRIVGSALDLDTILLEDIQGQRQRLCHGNWCIPCSIEGAEGY